MGVVCRGGSKPPFWGTITTQKYHSPNFVRSKPMGCRSQKYRSLPNMAVGSSSKLGSKPPFWGTITTQKYHSPNFVRSKPMGCRSQKHRSLPNMAVGSSSKLMSKLPFWKPPFWGSITTQKYHSPNFVRSKPIDCRSQKYRSLPNMAVGLLSKLVPKPHCWKVLHP